MSAAPELVAKKTLPDVVRECLAAAGNNRDTASQMAVAYVLRSGMAREIVREAVEEGIDKVLHSQYKHQRAAALRGRIERVVSGARLRVAEAVARISDFPLPSGTTLRDSLRADVLAAERHWMAQSETMLGRGLWLRMIAERMRPDETRTVGQIFSDKKLEALLDTARKRATEAAK